MGENVPTEDGGSDQQGTGDESLTTDELTGALLGALTVVPLWRAVSYVEDAAERWLEEMPAILAAYPQITPDSYWRMTVAEQATLIAAATKRG